MQKPEFLRDELLVDSRDLEGMGSVRKYFPHRLIVHIASFFHQNELQMTTI